MRILLLVHLWLNVLNFQSDILVTLDKGSAKVDPATDESESGEPPAFDEMFQGTREVVLMRISDSGVVTKVDFDFLEMFALGKGVETKLKPWLVI